MLSFHLSMYWLCSTLVHWWFARETPANATDSKISESKTASNLSLIALHVQMTIFTHSSKQPKLSNCFETNSILFWNWVCFIIFVYDTFTFTYLSRVNAWLDCWVLIIIIVNVIFHQNIKYFIGYCRSVVYVCGCVCRWDKNVNSESTQKLE